MSVNEPLSYEAAVLGEEVERISRVLLEALDRETAEVPADMKAAFQGAALGSVAQLIDGAEYRRDGVTGRLAVVVAMWLRNQQN